jgi:hypothetical protein
MFSAGGKRSRADYDGDDAMGKRGFHRINRCLCQLSCGVSGYDDVGDDAATDFLVPNVSFQTY